MTKQRILTALFVGAACVVSNASAATATWTDWTSISSNNASGTMGGVTVSVSSTNAMDGPSQTACGTNYWTEPNALDRPYTGGSLSNAPTACEQVGLDTANTVTVTFSSAIDSLYMALLSVGRTGTLVTYDFDRAFVIDSEGQGYWGNDAFDGVMGAGDTLGMREFHGVVRFTSPVTTLTFSTTPNEYWHAFTFGFTAVPEPGTLALLGLGLAGLGFARRRKQ